MVRVLVVRRLFLLFACAIATLAFGQNAPFDENKWADLTEGKSYTEKADKARNDVDLPKFDLGLNAEVVKYAVFFIVFALLVYFLVRYLLTLQSNAAAPEEMKIDVRNLQEAEENPMHADLVKLIAKLVEESKFREATRAYFLLILQRLYHNNYIDWQKPKTNFDYVREVNQYAFHASFNTLTAFFEMTWYGDKTLEKADFMLMEPQFKNLVTTIDDARKK